MAGRISGSVGAILVIGRLGRNSPPVSQQVDRFIGYQLPVLIQQPDRNLGAGNPVSH